MIWESAPWKQQLVRDVGRIRRLAKTKLCPEEDNEREYLRIERLVFVTAYSMRKLWESNKLSTNWNDQKLSCIKYPIKGDVPDRLNWHKIDRHYDLGLGQAVSIQLFRRLHLNQVGIGRAHQANVAVPDGIGQIDQQRRNLLCERRLQKGYLVRDAYLS
jgi:hypothetical protein